MGVMRAWPTEDQELRGPGAGTGTWLAEGPGACPSWAAVQGQTQRPDHPGPGRLPWSGLLS